MNDLLKKDVQWLWGPAQEKLFVDVKQALVNAMTITFYDPQKPITVSADASSFGIGAVYLARREQSSETYCFCVLYTPAC
jgi:hypothetical protein